MILFVELCVDLKKGKLAKDGLYQYKNTAQNTNVGTIEVGHGHPGHSSPLIDSFVDKVSINLACPQKIYRTCGTESHGSASQSGRSSIIS